MLPENDNPLNDWFIAHEDLVGSDSYRLVDVWGRAAEINGNALHILGAWEEGYGGSVDSLPDLVECVALYGYSRLLIQGWKNLPIKIPAVQAEAWREWGFGATLNEFRERQAGIAGGFLELAGRDPERTKNTVEAELKEKMSELRVLIEKPPGEYIPQRFTEQELDESDWFLESDQRDHLDRPFKLYEQLICFDYGFQKFRMFCVTEEDKELNLPNKELYEALQQIDLSRIQLQLDVAEPKLRQILRHLTKHNYLELNNVFAPETFWWRHAQRVPQNDR